MEFFSPASVKFACPLEEKGGGKREGKKEENIGPPVLSIMVNGLIFFLWVKIKGCIGGG